MTLSLLNMECQIMDRRLWFPSRSPIVNDFNLKIVVCGAHFCCWSVEAEGEIMSVAVFCHSPLSSRQPHHGFLLWLVCNTLCAAALNIKIQKIALNNCWFNIMEPASTAEFEAAAVLWLNQRDGPAPAPGERQCCSSWGEALASPATWCETQRCALDNNTCNLFISHPLP